MKKRLILALTAALALGSCMSFAAAADELDTENPIKIGYVGALSGDTALWGQAGLNGMELTASQLNEEGGILGREVQIVGLDGKGVSDDSVAAGYETGDAVLRFYKGDCIFIPANSVEIRIHGQAQFLDVRG